MSLVARTRLAGSFEPQGFVAFECGGEHVGWMRPDFAGQLRRWPDCFSFGRDRIVLSEALDTVESRTAALAQCTEVLAQEGLVTGWRNETYAILPEQGGSPLFHIERAAMRVFGLTAHGANLNAYVSDGDSIRMWVARRSLSKPIDPGLLDNLVGGGIASGYSAWETLIKECHEEAGIPATVAARARSAGYVQTLHEVPEGVHSEIVYVYDLALPPAFVPANQDGEVSESRLASIPEVLALFEQGEFCVEAGLVALDFILRHQLMAAAHPDFDALSRILKSYRSPLPTTA